MPPSFSKNSFQGPSHLPHLGPVFLQIMFMTKKRWIWKHWERFLSIIGPRRKAPSFFTQVSWFWRNIKNTGVTGKILHFWSDLGKIHFSHSLCVQITFVMSQMKNRLQNISNDLSWAQFGIEEVIQKWSAPALCISAPTFNAFWTVLGESVFGQVNELQSRKKLYI